MRQDIKIIEDFVEPIVKKAIERAEEEGRLAPLNGQKSDAEKASEVEEGQSLLDHLVQFTRGKSRTPFAPVGSLS